MPTAAQPVLAPRKSPIQARSNASVSAILEATLQVLLSIGKERLTTTRVAARAGVSVGTLYQYFPNKSALLQAALRSHLEEVWSSVEATCLTHRGATLNTMVTAVIGAFLDAKMQRPRVSAALYAVSADVDGTRISRQIGERVNLAIADLLASSSDPLDQDPHLITAVLYGAMIGTSRILLESPNPERLSPQMREELVLLACAYLAAHSKATTKSAATLT